tara:strand:- start:666 stop:875 length:210 start_codon:yes stop_codon:yes gene_type:complete
LDADSGEASPGVEASVLYPELFEGGAKRGFQQGRPPPGGAATLERESEEEKRGQSGGASAGRGAAEFFR